MVVLYRDTNLNSSVDIPRLVISQPYTALCPVLIFFLVLVFSDEDTRTGCVGGRKKGVESRSECRILSVRVESVGV